MFAVVGITGQVGGAVARQLLAEGKRVRAIVRSADEGTPWAALGCDVAVANVDDADAMGAAFKGVEGVFLINPPNYDPEPGFPKTHRTAAALKQALDASQPGRVVLLSTIGAQVAEFNLLNNGGIMEAGVRMTNAPVAILRAAWFMENASWDVEAAKAGCITSFLQPAEHAIPMVATADIAAMAVELLHDTWAGVRVVELAGPRAYSADDLASTFSRLLGRTVAIDTVPRDTWENLFRRQGMKNPLARMRMLDGFNEDWIDFEGRGTEKRTGTTTLEAVLHNLVTQG